MCVYIGLQICHGGTLMKTLCYKWPTAPVDTVPEGYICKPAITEIALTFSLHFFLKTI